MDAILQTAIQYLIEIIGLVIISALGIFGTWILNKINQAKKLKNIRLATEQVIDATITTVKRLQQTVVDAYKESSETGKLSKEQIEELKLQTQEITLDMLAAPTINLLEAAKIDVFELITNTAEAYIKQLKIEEIN